MRVDDKSAIATRADGVVFRNAKKNDAFDRVFHEKMGQGGEVQQSQEGNLVGASDRLVSLGRITKGIRTVSDLLQSHPDYRAVCWEVVHAEKNRDKPFTRIQPGTEIFIDPVTKELSWERSASGKGGEVHFSQAPAGRVGTQEIMLGAEAPLPSNLNLADAVTPYLGKKYSEIDCYELVVRSLGKMGVRYEGRGGLLDRLTKMASDKGLPANAFLNGEGLIEATGSKVFANAFSRLGNNWQDRAKEVFGQIEPVLEKGMILSFSTPTKGHTGIVSQQNGMWTFINSGRMDHPVEVGSRGKAVGEEVLRQEIDNWFQLAAKRGEGLQITLGRIEEDKIRMAMTTEQQRSGTVPL